MQALSNKNLSIYTDMPDYWVIVVFVVITLPLITLCVVWILEKMGKVRVIDTEQCDCNA